jgi:hypothetical protein
MEMWNSTRGLKKGNSFLTIVFIRDIINLSNFSGDSKTK